MSVTAALRSQIVQVRRELFTRENAQVVGVVCNLVCVHHRAWYFDRAHEVEVVVAQMVRELLNLALSQC